MGSRTRMPVLLPTRTPGICACYDAAAAIAAAACGAAAGAGLIDTSFFPYVLARGGSYAWLESTTHNFPNSVVFAVSVCE